MVIKEERNSILAWSKCHLHLYIFFLGSGKSYTMMGAPNQKGLIPRICDSLFEQIQQSNDPNTTFKVEVSYMEIYNEKVRDLLCPKR